MNHQQDLGVIARTIIDSNMYMVLGTADDSGNLGCRQYILPQRDIQNSTGSRLQRRGTHATSLPVHK